MKIAQSKISPPPKLSISWEPFFLNRDTPPEGENLMEHLSRYEGEERIKINSYFYLVIPLY